MKKSIEYQMGQEVAKIEMSKDGWTFGYNTPNPFEGDNFDAQKANDWYDGYMEYKLDSIRLE